MGAHGVGNCFSHAAFKILSLYLTFGILLWCVLEWASLGPSCLGLSVLPGLVCLFPSPQ